MKQCKCCRLNKTINEFTISNRKCDTCHNTTMETSRHNVIQAIAGELIDGTTAGYAAMPNISIMLGKVMEHWGGPDAFAADYVELLEKGCKEGRAWAANQMMQIMKLRADQQRLENEERLSDLNEEQLRLKEIEAVSEFVERAPPETLKALRHVIHTQETLARKQQERMSATS